MPSAANQNLSNLATTIDSIPTGTPFNQTIQKVIRTESNGVVTYSRDEEDVGTSTSIPNNKFDYNSSIVAALIPDTMKSIGNMAFRQCANLKYINLDNVTSIGQLAFWQSALASINAPNVETIGGNAFEACPIGGTLNFPNLTSLGSGAFTSTKIEQITSLGSITSIGNNTFRGCVNLKTVALPSTIRSLGSLCFYDSGVTTVTGLEYVETVNSSFNSCPLSIELNMPNLKAIDGSFAYTKITKIISLGTVPSIAFGAFRDCYYITSVVLPSTVTEIGGLAFYNDGSLSSFTINATTPPTLGNGALNMLSSNLVIYVPSASVSAYQTASGWSAFASRIQAIPT